MSDKTSNLDLQAIQSIDKDAPTRPSDAEHKLPIQLRYGSLLFALGGREICAAQ